MCYSGSWLVEWLQALLWLIYVGSIRNKHVVVWLLILALEVVYAISLLPDLRQTLGLEMLKTIR